MKIDITEKVKETFITNFLGVNSKQDIYTDNVILLTKNGDDIKFFYGIDPSTLRMHGYITPLFASLEKINKTNIYSFPLGNDNRFKYFISEEKGLIYVSDNKVLYKPIPDFTDEKVAVILAPSNKNVFPLVYLLDYDFIHEIEAMKIGTMNMANEIIFNKELGDKYHIIFDGNNDICEETTVETKRIKSLDLRKVYENSFFNKHEKCFIDESGNLVEYENDLLGIHVIVNESFDKENLCTVIERETKQDDISIDKIYTIIDLDKKKAMQYFENKNEFVLFKSSCYYCFNEEIDRVNFNNLTYSNAFEEFLENKNFAFLDKIKNMYKEKGNYFDLYDFLSLNKSLSELVDGEITEITKGNVDYFKDKENEYSTFLINYFDSNQKSIISHFDPDNYKMYMRTDRFSESTYPELNIYNDTESIVIDFYASDNKSFNMEYKNPSGYTAVFNIDEQYTKIDNDHDFLIQTLNKISNISDLYKRNSFFTPQMKFYEYTIK